MDKRLNRGSDADRVRKTRTASCRHSGIGSDEKSKPVTVTPNMTAKLICVGSNPSDSTSGTQRRRVVSM
jgi:hypothetical protein